MPENYLIALIELEKALAHQVADAVLTDAWRVLLRFLPSLGSAISRNVRAHAEEERLREVARDAGSAYRRPGRAEVLCEGVHEDVEPDNFVLSVRDGVCVERLCMRETLALMDAKRKHITKRL
ncbi:hypothetical protein V7S43_011522 [Phytophthora oleae]|uniref:Uncharacterized protein n=1 Tax=Phytophthora oleae TaxID=2107226 RepID=A0ABD3FB29_9STRA